MKKGGITAYEIALSATSCAIATILLTVGIYSQIFLFTGYLFGGIALMLPLAKKSYLGYVLSYFSTCVLSLIFASGYFFDLLPFAMFFGLHPLVNELQLRIKINRWLACFAKAVWFDVAMYIIWRFVFSMTTSVALVDKYILPIIVVFGTLFFIVYDYAMYKWRFAVNKLVNRISKK
jgi:hypothetical protein